MTRRGKAPRATRRALPACLEATIAAAERVAIEEALEAAQGDRGRAARALGLSVRTLDRRLGEFGLRGVANGIALERLVEEEGDREDPAVKARVMLAKKRAGV